MRLFTRYRARAIAALIALFAAASASAQTSPNFTFREVPTVEQWNALFAGKQDWLGAPPLLITGGTLTGPVATAASLTSNAGFNIAPGVAPTSPNNGDLWTTAAGLYVRINGATIGPLGTAACPTCAVTNATNTFTATQSISLNSAPTAALLSGTVLQLQGATGGIARLEVDSLGNVGALSCIRADGTTGSPTAIQSGEEICTLNGGGYDGSTFSAGWARISLFAAQTSTPTAHGSRIVFSTTINGSITRTDAMAIENDGGVTLNGVASQGTGTLNVPNGIYNNGAAPTGVGGYVRLNSPVLVTPALGVASATSLALGGCTISANALCVTGSSAFGAITLGGGITAAGNNITGIGTLSVSGTFTATGLVTLADLATQATNTALVNATSGTASPTAQSMPSCSVANNALQWLTNTGFQCATVTAAATNIAVGTTGVTGSTTNFLLYNSGGTLSNTAIASILTQGSGISITGTTNATIALSLANATLQASPSNPSGTTSASAVMMGIGGSCHITPVYSTRVRLSIQGYSSNNTTVDQVLVNARFGTGTAPINGAASIGTSVGSTVQSLSSPANYQTPFNVGGIITGLSAGTAYWFDLAVSQGTGGTASVGSLSCSADEF